MSTVPTPTPAEFEASLLTAALRYAQLGFGVFPLHSPKKIGLCDCTAGPACTNVGKHPRTPNGFKDATTDELTIRRWWRENPRANIGIAVPNGYAVLDVDGAEGHNGVMAKTGGVVPITPTATTGKGNHYWYTTDGSLPPRAKMLPQVDLRGPGSYVVAPPSLHARGVQYLWDTPLWGADGLLAELEPAPDWLVELAKQPAYAGAGAGAIGKIDVPGVLQGVPEGKRDAELFRCASKLRYADVPYEVALQLIVDAAAACVPPFPQAEAVKKVDSAYGRYKPRVDLTDIEGSAQYITDDEIQVVLSSDNGPVEFTFKDLEKINRALDCELSVRLLAPGNNEDVYEQHLDLLSASQRDSVRRDLDAIYGFAAGKLPKLINHAFSAVKTLYLGKDKAERLADLPAPDTISYIVEDVVLEERPTILFGAGSASKTWLLMSMMIAISRGEPWLGRPTQQRNCMLIDYETGKNTSAYRMSRLCEALGLPGIPPNIMIWPANGVPLHDQRHAIRESCIKNNIGFIGIDHCGAACGTEPERAESALRFYRTVQYWGLPVCAIAHITNEAEKGNPEDVRKPFGSGYWNNGAGMTWFIKRGTMEEGADVVDVGLFARKYNDSSRPADFGVTIVYEGKRGPIAIEEAMLRNSQELTAARGHKYVIELALVVPMTAADIADTTGISLKTVRTTLERNPRMFVYTPGPETAKPGMWRRRTLDDYRPGYAAQAATYIGVAPPDDPGVVTAGPVVDLPF